MISYLSLLALVITVAVTAYDALRFRRRGQMDVFVFVGSLAVIVLLSNGAKRDAAISIPYIIRTILLLAQPYLIVRIAAHFCPLPRFLQTAAMLGTIVGSALVLLRIPHAQAPRTLLIGVYFVIVEGIAAWAFTRQARRTSGVISWRLRFIAAASWLLVLLVVVSSGAAYVPWFRLVVSQTSALQAAGIIICYYLGLAMPRPFRRFGQHEALYEFLRTNAERSPHQRALAAAESLCDAAQRSTGAAATFVVLADGARDRLRLAAASSAGLAENDEQLIAGIIGLGIQGLPDTPSFPTSGGVLIVPIGSRTARLWGAVIVAAESGPVFPQDDSEIVCLMALHAANALDQDAALTERAALERRVQHHRHMELEDARQRLADILEAATDFVMMSPPEGPPLYINRAARTSLGIGPEETIDTLFAFRPPEYERLFRTIILPTLERDGVWSGQTDYVTRAGRHIPTSQVSMAHRNAAGDIEFLSTISRDISELRRTEEGLRRAEERTQFALEAAGAGIWELDLATRALTWSETMMVVLGLGREAFRTREQMLALIHPDDLAKVRQSMRQPVSVGGPFEFQFRTLRPDGSTHWMESRGRVLTDAAGRPVRVLGLAQDVTKRKALEESRERMVNMLEATPDFVTIGRLAAPPLYINPAARAALGIGPTEDVPSLLEFRPAGFGEFLESTVLPTAIRLGSWIGDAEYVSRTGRVIPVSQVSLVHRNIDGEVEYISTMAMDVSEHRRLESQLRQSQKMEAVGQLAGGVAHDFNNLLTVILNNADFIVDDPDASDQDRTAAAEIKSAAARGAGLTRQLLAFGRRQVLQPQVTTLSRVARQLLPMLQRLLGDHIVIDGPTKEEASDPPVFADVTQLEQVILNLAINAGDAMPNGGRLTISTGALRVDASGVSNHQGLAPGYHAVLSVADMGEGIAPDNLARIFEPFFTTKPFGHGTGLGLSTVHGIVKQMRGTVDVESTVGVGTTFRVFIPESSAPDVIRPIHSDEDRPAGSLKGTETILVVEDEASVRRLIVRMLTALGYAVTATANMTEALAAVTSGMRPDLVVTDLQMPGGSGLELIDALRKIIPGVRVILISGYSVDGAKAAASYPFVPKPFRGSELASMVRSTLDQ